MKRSAVLLSFFLSVGCTRSNPLANGGCLCNTPPANFCLDLTTLRSFASGHCELGQCSYDHWDVVCQSGCNNGACIGNDPCNGIQCVTPPAAACADGMTLLSYSSSGTCAVGACSYQQMTTSCAGACTSGACQGDPCAGKICDQPPASVCVGANTLRSFSAIGCSGGACSYGPTDTTCAGGCQAGGCANDPCAGVICLQPPASICLNATTRQIYQTPGTCTGGTCSYPLRSMTCAANATCTGGTCVCTPSCGGKACGASDGCNGKCQTGTCADPQTSCQSGKCVCTPVCGGAACGADDGCGGVCLAACPGMCSPACTGNTGCAAGSCLGDAAYLSGCTATGCMALPCKAGYREIPECFVSGVGESTPLCLRNEITEFWTVPDTSPCPTGTHAAWTADTFSTDCSSGPAPGGGFIYFEKLCLRDH